MSPGPRRLPRFRMSNDPTITTYRSPTFHFQLEPPVLPKHIPFPNMPKQSLLFYDVVTAIFGIVSLLLQLLNIYRSSWWLPGPHLHVLKFYLIDAKMCSFAIAIFGRKIYFMWACQLFLGMYHDPARPTYLNPRRKWIIYLMYFAATGALGGMIINTTPKFVYYVFPFALYLIIFRGHVAPFFATNTWNYTTEVPIHACTSSPVEIRKECEYLKNDFNNRIQYIGFNAILHGYFAGFIPICFAQSQLIYDSYWCWQNIILITWSSFMFSFVNLLPLRYWDIMHRSATHLGSWDKLENHTGSMQATYEWRDDILWPNGIILKYRDQYWKAVGECNSNKPGDERMNRYYNMFIYPPNVFCYLFGAHFIIVLYQLILLFHLICWEKIITMSIIAFFNLWAVFKSSRDYLVSHSLYKLTAEQIQCKPVKHIIQKPFERPNEIRSNVTLSRSSELNNIEHKVSFNNSNHLLK